jgi:hypothetical protein
VVPNDQPFTTTEARSHEAHSKAVVAGWLQELLEARLVQAVSANGNHKVSYPFGQQEKTKRAKVVAVSEKRSLAVSVVGAWRLLRHSPGANRPVIAAGNQEPAVRGQGKSVDRAGMPLEAMQLLTRVDVPQPDVAVAAPGSAPRPGAAPRAVGRGSGSDSASSRIHFA